MRARPVVVTVTYMQTRGSSAALSLRGLSKAYGPTLAVDRLDLDVPRGSFFGLVGPNGAGKTTTLSMATGLLRPDAGTAHVLGHDVWSDTGVGPDIVTEDVSRAGVRPQKSRRHGQCGGLAGAVGSHEAEERPPRDIEIKPIDRERWPIGFGQTAQAQRRGGSPSLHVGDGNNDWPSPCVRARSAEVDSDAVSKVAHLHALRSEALQLGQIELTADGAEQYVVDRNADLGCYPLCESHGVAAGRPGRVERHREYVDLPGLGVVGVPWMEQTWLALHPDHDTEIADPGQRLVDQGVLLAHWHDEDPPERQLLARHRVLRPDPGPRHDSGGLRLGIQQSLWVGLQHRRKPLQVNVIRVLMGDQDDVEPGDVHDARREHPRVDQDALAAGLDEQAGMSEMSEAHGVQATSAAAGAPWRRSPASRTTARGSMPTTPAGRPRG